VQRDRWFAVLNPIAGGGRGLRGRARIERLLADAGVPFVPAVSEHAGQTIDLARVAAREGFRRFIAIGGDGTLNELLNGAFSGAGSSAGGDASAGGSNPADQVTLALVPVGRGDDWARTHRIPRRLEDSIRLVAAGRAVAHDVGVADFQRDGNRRLFLNVAGVGFDAHVVERTLATRLGPLTYLAGLVRGFATYAAPRMAVSADGLRLDEPLFVTFAAVGRYCGGGMQVAPGAATDDGLLDIVTIGEVGKLELVANLRRLFDGTLPDYKKVKTVRTARAQVATSPPARVQADGELLGEAPVTFSVLPRAVRVIVP
jgi:YegS/Rv2252/BmrU family lipid kinase